MSYSVNKEGVKTDVLQCEQRDPYIFLVRTAALAKTMKRPVRMFMTGYPSKEIAEEKNFTVMCLDIYTFKAYLWL